MQAQAGKYLLIAGGILLLFGALLYLFPGSFKWLGRLPGDIHIARGNFSFYFPLTSLLLLNLLLFLLMRIWRWLH